MSGRRFIYAGDYNNSTQNIKVIYLICFNELALKNRVMNMHFNPLPKLIRPFTRGGGGFFIDSDPPAFIGLMHGIL